MGRGNRPKGLTGPEAQPKGDFMCFIDSLIYGTVRRDRQADTLTDSRSELVATNDGKHLSTIQLWHIETYI